MEQEKSGSVKKDSCIVEKPCISKWIHCKSFASAVRITHISRHFLYRGRYCTWKVCACVVIAWHSLFGRVSKWLKVNLFMFSILRQRAVGRYGLCNWDPKWFVVVTRLLSLTHIYTQGWNQDQPANHSGGNKPKQQASKNSSTHHKHMAEKVNAVLYASVKHNLNSSMLKQAARLL